MSRLLPQWADLDPEDRERIKAARVCLQKLGRPVAPTASEVVRIALDDWIRRVNQPELGERTP